MKTDEALYINIYKYLRENIQNHCYANGQRLPTEMELAQQFYVSRITAKKALNMLAEEGLISRIPGRGSYVKDGNNPVMVYRTIGHTEKYIALVMGGYANSFGYEIIHGALEAAEELGYHLVVKVTRSSQEREEQVVASLMASGTAGIILQPTVGEQYSPSVVKAIYNGYPLVMIDRNMQGINVPFVGVDNRELSRLAAGKLLEQGHQNIALISLHDEATSTIGERIYGFVDAHVDGMSVVDKNLWLVGMDKQLESRGLSLEDAGAYEVYVEAIMYHLRAHPEITAVLGTEYYASKAVLDAIRRIGKRVPEDISLVSFDADQSYVGSHNITHIKQPQIEMGRRACEALHEVIEGRRPEPFHMLLPGEWVKGSSLGKPNRG